MQKTDQLNLYFMKDDMITLKTCQFSLITLQISNFYIHSWCGNKKCHIKCEKISQNFKLVFFLLLEYI